MQADALCLLDRRDAGYAARFHLVVGNLGLTVDGYDLAGLLMKIDALPPFGKVDFQTLVYEPLAMEARRPQRGREDRRYRPRSVRHE